MSGQSLAWVDGRFVHYLYMPTITRRKRRRI